jgi:hypothetical protein
MTNRIGNFLKVFRIIDHYEKDDDYNYYQKLESWIPIKEIKEIRSYDEMKKLFSFDGTIDDLLDLLR